MSPAPAKRRPTPAEAKVARQKKILIAGCVLLVVMLALLGPRTFKQLHKTQVNTIPPSMRGVPVAAAEAATPVAGTPTQLSDTDVVTVQPGSGQLVSFGLFKSKDPFVQQLASATPAASSTPSAAYAVPTGSAAPKQVVTVPSLVTTPAPTTTAPPVSTPAATVPAAPAPAAPIVSTPQSTAPTPSGPTPTSAAIATNGHCEVVDVKATFPKGDDVFRLVSIAGNATSVKIGVAGGAYESGAASVTLKRGTPLTLVNTANGVRYRLSLLTACPATSAGSSDETVPAPAPATTTTATATAPASTVTAPAPTTPTSTTP